MTKRYVVPSVIVTGVIVLLVAGVWRLREFELEVNRVVVKWEGNDLTISAYTGYPYVVTHLGGVSAVGSDGMGQGCVAQLPSSLFYVDSKRLWVPEKAFKALHWVDSNGNPIAAPATGSPVTAFYFKPLESNFSH